MAVMYQVGTFLNNYLRAILLILFRLIFLGAVSLWATTFLSFPVAVLLCFMIFLMATVSGFLTESFGFLDKDIGKIYDVTIKWMVDLLPKFDRDNPTKFLVGGRFISGALLARAGAVMVGLWGIGSVALGLWIYSKREVGRSD
jgi:hypothetical protein